MTKFFIGIYDFLKDRKWLMYTLLIASTAVFAWFGMKVRYEENIAKLLPQAEEASEASLAFENLRVKDKIFIQVLPKEGNPGTEALALMCEEFTDSLLSKDAETGYIDNILCGIDDDLMVMGLDYVLGHLPSYVDASAYASFDSLLTYEAISAQMAENHDMVMADEEGSVSTMVSMDPCALRGVILGSLAESQGDGSVPGFRIIDGHLFSADSTVALAFLAPDFNSMDSKAGTRLVKMMEKEIEAFEESHPDMEVLFHGAPVQSVFNARQIKKDLLGTIGISLLIIVIVLGICFRNRSTVFMLLAPVAYGALLALACMWWIKGCMSLMALGIGAIVLGVALSYCLHIVTHYKYVSDPVQVLRDEAKPVILGCITTIGAFAGLLFTSSELLQDFGLFASFAMVGTVLFVLIFLPHFFRPEKNRKSEAVFSTLDRVNSYPVERIEWLRWVIVTVCIVCFIYSGKVVFDSDLRNIGYNETKVLRSQHTYSTRSNGGYTSMYYAAGAETLDEALTLSKSIDSVLDSLEEEGVVAQHTDVTPLFVTMGEQEDRIALWKEYWNGERISEVRADVSKAALECGLNAEMFEPFYTMLEADYEASDLYEAGIIPESLMGNFIEEADGKYMVFSSAKMAPEAKTAVNAAVGELPHAVVVDPFWYTSDMVKVLNDDFNVVLGISSVFVFIVLLLSFRSLLLSLVAFMPMALSWFVVNGMMYMLGLEFNLINIIIATFIFGIGVDYSIFVMNGLIAQARGEGDSLLTCHKTAIFFSALVLMVVVGTHPAIRSIGVTTLIGMSSTLVLTYTLQPALFNWLMRFDRFAQRYGKK